MAPVRPPIMPPTATAVRPVNAPPSRSPDQSGGAAAENTFKPGLEAPRAAASRPINAPPPQAMRQVGDAPPVGEARQLFTLQALSAYAGAIINDMEPASGSPAAAPARGHNSDTPPPRPGGQLDLKV